MAYSTQVLSQLSEEGGLDENLHGVVRLKGVDEYPRISPGGAAIFGPYPEAHCRTSRLLSKPRICWTPSQHRDVEMVMEIFPKRMELPDNRHWSPLIWLWSQMGSSRSCCSGAAWLWKWSRLNAPARPGQQAVSSRTRARNCGLQNF